MAAQLSHRRLHCVGIERELQQADLFRVNLRIDLFLHLAFEYVKPSQRSYK